MEEIEYWEAVRSRNRAFDGVFVYAVRSTGIYCRPSCPSRRPQREHVQFFGSPAGAEQAGYRACRRCQPEKRTPDEPNLALVQRICRYLSEPRDQLPTLDELAQEFHLSPYHLQRTFKRIVGVTPAAIRGGATPGAVQGRSEAGGIRDRRALRGRLRIEQQRLHPGGPTIRDDPRGLSRWRRRRHLLHRCRITARLAAGRGHDKGAVRGQARRLARGAGSRARQRIPRRGGDAGRCGIGRTGDGADGLPARRAAAPRPAAGRSGDRVSAASLARAAGDPGWQHALLRGGRRRHRPADRGTGRRTRLRHQPCRAGDPVSPGDPGRRRVWAAIAGGWSGNSACLPKRPARPPGWMAALEETTR